MKSFFILLIFIFSFSTLYSYTTVGTDSTIDILTWNIEFFPKSNANTIAEVRKIVTDLQVDLIAVQEIASVESFNTLIGELPGWKGRLSSHTYSDGTYQKVGILYREAVITVNDAQLILSNYWYDLPRPPMEFSLTAVENDQTFDFQFIVLHLKARSDQESENRRRESIRLLKNYIDQKLASSEEQDFIVAGDYNDQLEDPLPTPNVFTLLIQDSTNYTFLTMPLAGIVGSYIGWSSASLIDHIMVTSDALEEYGQAGAAKVLFLDEQNSQYENIVSDHRPVLAQFAFTNQSPEKPVHSIAQIQQQFNQLIGQTVTVRGVITLGAGILHPTSTIAYIQDESGSGINIYKSGSIVTDLQKGAYAEVTGIVYNYNGLHEIKHQTHRIISTGHDLPKPVVIPTADVAETNDQGRWVQIMGRITSINGSEDGIMLVDDGSGAGKIFFDADASLDISAFQKNDSIKITGVKSVYDDSGEVIPGYQSDIQSWSLDVSNLSPSGKPPSIFRLNNYPNPFNAGTIIFCQLPHGTQATLWVSNILGQQVAKLCDCFLAAGTHQFTWNGDANSGEVLNSGVYFLQLNTGKIVLNRKILLLK